MYRILEHRELLHNLIMRDLKTRYKQTVIGVGWTLLGPLAMMVIFTIVFSMFVRIPVEGAPYPVFCYIGLIVWAFFTNSISRGTSSVVQNSNLITKVYFPREILPLSTVITSVVDFLIGLVFFIILILIYQVPLSYYIWLLPLVLLIQVVLATSIIFFTSALNVFQRDINYIVPLILQIWMFLSPIIYPVSLVPERYQGFYMLNPIAGIIEGYRSILLYNTMPDWGSLGSAALISVIMLVVTYRYFKRSEMTFADVI